MLQFQLQTLVVHGITPRINRAQTLTRQLSHWVQRGTDAHKVAVIGDTVGDPLKDTSGPSLNILIKLMAVESLVYAPFFAHGGLFFKLL